MAVPKILFNMWFWYVLIAVIIVINFIWGKTPAPKEPGKFFLKHQKAITKITDIFVICIVLLFGCALLTFPVRSMYESLSESEPVRSINLHFAIASFFMRMTIVTGFSGVFIGMLSVFQVNLTRMKRTILFTICILPILFLVLRFMTDTTQKPIQLLQICIGTSSASWIINFPAIFFGIHFFSVAQKILCKLRLASKESFVNEEQD